MCHAVDSVKITTKPEIFFPVRYDLGGLGTKRAKLVWPR